MCKKTKKGLPGAHYIRYLVSFIAVLLIPLIVISSFYTSRFLKSFYNEIYKTVDLELEQISISLENETQTMRSVVNQIVLTGAVNLSEEAQQAFHFRELIASLSGFCATHSFLDEIIVILNNSNYIALSKTTCERGYFFNNIFTSTQTSPEELENVFYNSVAPFYLPSQNILNRSKGEQTQENILFGYPLYTDYQKHVGTVVFCIRSESINRPLATRMQSYGAQVYILDETMRIISSSGENDIMRPFLASSAGKTPPEEIDLDGEKYLMRTYTSSVNGWAYVAFIPNKQASFSQVSEITRDFWLALLVVVILSALLIFLLQKVNYSPMRKLRDKAHKLSPNGTSKNELKTISAALDYLSDQNTSLSTKLEKGVAAIRNERLNRLLCSKYQSKEDFNIDCSEIELHLPHPYFFISILMFHGTIKDVDAFALDIKNILSKDVLCYYLYTFEQNKMILIQNVPASSVANVSMYAKLQKQLSKAYKVDTSIGVGTCVNSTHKIAASYIEAVSALDYRFVKGNGTVIEFAEAVNSYTPNITYPRKEFERLQNAMLSRNEESIQKGISDIIDYISNTSLPLHLARSICFDLVSLVNQQFSGKSYSRLSSPVVLSGIETSKEIVQILKNWSAHLRIETPKANIEHTHFESVLTYLEENCLRCDFSIYETAEYFVMTLPNFSKYFKNASGQNVMDYTTVLRMAHAKKLLQNTALPLKDVSEQVGYYNVSSFVRRFKLIEGVTPANYRKLSSK